MNAARPRSRVAASAVDPIPSGTRDVLPDEMRELRAMTTQMADVFAQAGYGEVSTPTLEYAQTFARANLTGTEPAYRVFDDQGGGFVLRPDMTVPIARLAATRYAEVAPPLRFAYCAPVYRGVAPQRGQAREVLQAGVELIGLGGAEGTAEILSLLCAALDGAGLTEYRIGLGDAALYPSLLQAVGLAFDAQDAIIAALADGDFVGVERELRAAGLSDADCALLLGMASTRGGPEVLDGVQRRLQAALAPLRDVHGRLEAAVAERIIFDLGLVRSLGYYTGAVFQVYDPAAGMPIGSGGRYDDLLGSFGRPLPAVGFQLNVERLHVAASSEHTGLAATHPRRP